MDGAILGHPVCRLSVLAGCVCNFSSEQKHVAVLSSEQQNMTWDEKI